MASSFDFPHHEKKKNRGQLIKNKTKKKVNLYRIYYKAIHFTELFEICIDQNGKLVIVIEEKENIHTHTHGERKRKRETFVCNEDYLLNKNFKSCSEKNKKCFEKERKKKKNCSNPLQFASSMISLTYCITKSLIRFKSLNLQ